MKNSGSCAVGYFLPKGNFERLITIELYFSRSESQFFLACSMICCQMRVICYNFCSFFPEITKITPLLEAHSTLMEYCVLPKMRSWRPVKQPFWSIPRLRVCTGAF